MDNFNNPCQCHSRDNAQEHTLQWTGLYFPTVCLRPAVRCSKATFAGTVPRYARCKTDADDTHHPEKMAQDSKRRTLRMGERERVCFNSVILRRELRTRNQCRNVIAKCPAPRTLSPNGFGLPTPTAAARITQKRATAATWHPCDKTFCRQFIVKPAG